ncbi:MAG: Rpn family recombination-promoting nuclease/putative transposase [Thiomargarita sp.]|nr:Rpn family recombination-promoting nuclease/putative transposase [Thiomargarita sp.]
MKQVAPLRYDVIFKKAFSHPAIFTAISKDFLGIQLEISKVENDKAFIPSIGSIATKFDLFAEDKKNRVIVEVQHAHYSDSYERFFYDQCSTMVKTIASSDGYHFPMTVITIVFFTGKNSPSPDSGIVVQDFEAKDFVTGRLLDNVYQRQHRIIFVFTKDFAHADTPEPCREWMQAIDDSLDEKVNEKEYSNPSIQELFKVIEKEKITPEERARMKDEYNQENAEKQSFKKGKNEGWKNGKDEGLKEGKEKGMKEGKEKMKEAARNLKALGTLTMEQIASATGLTLKVVKAL